MGQKAIQDYYPDDFGQCYGCGPYNDHGLQIKSFWKEETDETVCHFKPQPYHTAVPGVVYGGLIASLIDCHGTGTAAGAAYRAEGRALGTDPPLRYVTASLQVDYLKPTPIETTLEIRGRVSEIKGRKITVDVTLATDKGEICAKGRVVTVRIPDNMVLGTK